MGENPKSGHRERLKRAFMAGEAQAQTESALLELLLFQIVPIQDVKPRVEELLSQHGSLSAVLQAEGEWPEKLRNALLLLQRLSEKLAALNDPSPNTRRNSRPSPEAEAQPTLFPIAHDLESEVEPIVAPTTVAETGPKFRQGIAGTIMLKEAIRILPELQHETTEEAARRYLRANLRYNSAETRQRNTSYLMRQIFTEGYPDLTLSGFAARFAGTPELRDVCYYRLCKAEPLLREVVEDLLTTALPQGALDRTQLRRYIQARYPYSRSAEDYIRSVVESWRAGDVLQVTPTVLRLSYRELRLASFAFILHSEYPQPGMHQIEALQANLAIQAMLWHPDRILPALYELRNLGWLAKVSEIDRFRQFTTQWTPQEWICQLSEGVSAP